MQYAFTSPEQPARSTAPSQQQQRSTALSFPNSDPSAPPSNLLSSLSPSAAALSSLRSAAQLIDRELSYDEQRTDSLDLLDTRDSGHYRYEKPQLTLTRHISLPPDVLSAYDTVECHSSAGLLPAIQRAFLTLDNRLYVVNYHDPSDYYAYTDLQQLIITVALVTPKPGIFAPSIPYLLLLATPVEVHLLAVTFTTASFTSPLTLYPTAFSIASDGVTFLDAVSTSTGRIFLAGKDGHLYELDYQARDGWFRRKIRKLRVTAGTALSFPLPSFLWASPVDPIERVVVDESRNPPLLFTLQRSSTVAVYSLGVGAGSVRLLSTHARVWEEAKELLYNLHPNSTEDWVNRADFAIAAIHPTPSTESERIVLTATTTHGHRLYFTLYDAYNYYNTLRVKLVRLSPPGLQEPEVRGNVRPVNAFEPAWRKGTSPAGVHFVFNKGGVVLLAESIPDGGDQLLCLSRDFAPTNKLVEAVDSNTLPAKLADIAETSSTTSSSSALASCVYARGQQRPLVGLSEFATQHLVGPRVFVGLTAVSAMLWSRRRAIDDLCEVLMRRRRSLDDEELSLFFHRYGWKEAGAMLLTLATSVPSALALSDGRGVEERKEGGELYILSPAKYDHHPIPDDTLVKQAKQTFFRFAALHTQPAPTVPLLPSAPVPPLSSGGMSYSLTPFTPSLSLSPSVSSLVLFISRILRPVWDWPIAVITSTPIAAPPTLTLRYSPAQLSELRGWLQRLTSFLDEHHRLLARAKDDPSTLHQLLSLLSITLELTSALHLLSTHSAALDALLSSLPPPDAAVLTQSKFYDLITTPPSYLILKQLMLHSSSTLTPGPTQWVQTLHDTAPTFFSHSDLLLYQASLTLQRLRPLYDDRDRAAVVDEVLTLYRMAARGAAFPVQEVVAGLREAGVWEGAVEVALYRAELLARGEVARPGGVEDEEEWQAGERAVCYQVVVDTLAALLFPTSPLPDPSVVDVVLSVCLSSPDTGFLAQLYPFLIQRDLKSVLFSHPSPHLPVFLAQHEGYALLLRDYYLLHRMHRDASILLHQLSLTRSAEYSLNDRLGFLSRALACAREALEQGDGVTGSAEGDSEYCEALKERIEVAKLQQKLQTRLGGVGGKAGAAADVTDPALKDSVRRLDEELMDVEGLYLLAHSFSLWDVCLAIFFFSNERHRDDVIAALWRNALRSEVAHHRGGMAKGGGSAGEDGGWESAMQEKLVEMVGLYGEVGFMFPLDLIVHECEYLEWKYGRQGGGVAEMLVRSGVDGVRLCGVYERLVGEAGGMEEGLELQMYESVAWLLEVVTAKRGGGGGTGWGGNVGLYGLCARCQEALTSLPATRQTDALARRFATLQQSISRMNGR